MMDWLFRLLIGWVVEKINQWLRTKGLSDQGYNKATVSYFQQRDQQADDWWNNSGGRRNPPHRRLDEHR